MKGNPKISAMLKAANFIVQPFVDIINRLSSNNDRDWLVKFFDGTVDQESYFLGSDSQVALVINRTNLTPPGSGTLRVTLVQAGEEVEADLTGDIVTDA